MYENMSNKAVVRELREAATESFPTSTAMAPASLLREAAYRVGQLRTAYWLIGFLLASFIATCILGLLATRALEPTASPTLCPAADVQLLDPTVIRGEQAVWL